MATKAQSAISQRVADASGKTSTVDKLGRRVAKKGEPVHAALAEKAVPTRIQEFATWLERETGYAVDPRSVYLGSALRGTFQKSDENQSRIAARTQEIADEKVAREQRKLDREAERIKRATDREAAKAEREERKAERDAEKASAAEERKAAREAAAAEKASAPAKTATAKAAPKASPKTSAPAKTTTSTRAGSTAKVTTTKSATPARRRPARANAAATADADF